MWQLFSLNTLILLYDCLLASWLFFRSLVPIYWYLIIIPLFPGIISVLKLICIFSIYVITLLLNISSVQSLSCVQLFAAHQATLSITNSWSLPKLTSIESVMPSNHLILCHPLLLLPSIFPSIRVFSNDHVNSSREVAKVLEFQLQHQSFQWIFRVDLL